MAALHQEPEENLPKRFLRIVRVVDPDYRTTQSETRDSNGSQKRKSFWQFLKGDGDDWKNALDSLHLM